MNKTYSDITDSCLLETRARSFKFSSLLSKESRRGGRRVFAHSLLTNTIVYHFTRMQSFSLSVQTFLSISLLHVDLPPICCFRHSGEFSLSPWWDEMPWASKCRLSVRPLWSLLQCCVVAQRSSSGAKWQVWDLGLQRWPDSPPNHQKHPDFWQRDLHHWYWHPLFQCLAWGWRWVMIQSWLLTTSSINVIQMLRTVSHDGTIDKNSLGCGIWSIHWFKWEI